MSTQPTFYACDEHIDLAIDDIVDGQEQAPVMERAEAGTTCSYCKATAVYHVRGEA